MIRHPLAWAMFTRLSARSSWWNCGWVSIHELKGMSDLTSIITIYIIFGFWINSDFALRVNHPPQPLPSCLNILSFHIPRMEPILLDWFCTTMKSSCRAKIALSLTRKLTKFKMHWSGHQGQPRAHKILRVWGILAMPLLLIDDRPLPLQPVMAVSIMRTPTLIWTIMSAQSSNTDMASGP